MNRIKRNTLTMKLSVITLFMLMATGLKSQITNPIPTTFTNGLLVPSGVSAPFIGNGALWYNSSKLSYYNGSLWEYLASETFTTSNYAPLGRTLTINGVTFDLTQNRSWNISTTETDPTVPSYIKSITNQNIINWNTAFGWGNHATIGYAKNSGGNTFTGNQSFTGQISGTSGLFSESLQSNGFQSTFGNFTSVNPLGLGPNVSSLNTTNVTAQRTWEMPNKSGYVALLSDIPSISDVQSGTYNPSVTVFSNIANYTTYTFTWTRVGDIITAYGSINISPNSTGTLEFAISLPYGTIATQYDLNGTGNTKYEMGDVDAMSGDATNNRARVQLTVRNASFGRQVFLTYQYKHTSM